MKTTVSVLLCVLVSGVSFTCRTPKSEGLGKKIPRRVVSLVPSLTEIVYALDADDLLAGVTTYCDYPQQAKKKPKVGDFLFPDPEKLTGLEPDLVLLTSPTQVQLAQDLKAAGFRVAVFADPVDLEDVFIQIQSLADTLGVSGKGKELVDSLRSELDRIKPSRSRRTYVEISAEPLVTVGSRSYLTDAFSLIGLVNVFGDHKQPYPVIDPEQVVKLKPDVALLVYPGADRMEFSQRLGWSAIPAVETGQVYDKLPVDELMRPGPRLIKALITVDSVVSHAG